MLTGGGAMSALIEGHDWTATPLGPPEAWPLSLRIAVGMTLGSKFPACIIWGPGLVTIYNDAFRPILGAKPEALGRPFNEVWSEAWETIGPIAERAFAGEATFIEDFPLTVERHGYPEEAYFTFCYSPIRDEMGRVAGVLDTIVETTGKVLAERRQAFLLQLEEKLRGRSEARELTLAAAEALGRHVGAARAGYGRIDAAGETVVVERDWTDGTVASLAGEARLLDGFGQAVIAELRAGRTLVVEDCLADPRTVGDVHSATWASIGTRSLVVVPLIRSERLRAILYIHEPVPRRWSDGDVRLAEDTAQRTWAAVERAQAEAALRESETQFRLMADAAPQIVWITDAEGRAEFFNRQWSDYTGAPYEPTTAADVAANFVHPDDAALTMERFDEARRTGGTFLVEHRIRSKDGGYRWFLVRGEPHRDAGSGEIVRWFGASVDIHDRRRAEAALLEREERLRLIVENARDYAIFTADSEGRIDTWLPGAARIFGWSEEEAVGRPTAMTFTPEDQEEGGPAMELATAREEGVAPSIRWHLRKDGSRVFIEGSATALRRSDGSIRGFLKIGQDVTERRTGEERQALLAREVDHRAKNALAVVQTMLRLTRADDVPSFARAVEGRVTALARAQTLLAEERWNGAALYSMLRSELAPFMAGQRADLGGPPVVLSPGVAQPLAMAVHELATNAAKHGALSAPEGRLSVSWSLEGGAGGMLRLRWAEAGGPPVAGAPTRRGFGSRVLEGTVHRQLGGVVVLSWARTGLVCDIEVPLGGRPAPVKGASDGA
jgi:PAS domain S-box-containing protein